MDERAGTGEDVAMPYVATDPRSQLVPSANAMGVPRAASYRELAGSPPEAFEPETWWTRSQAMVIAHSNVHAEDLLTVGPQQADDYVVLLLDPASIAITHETGVVVVNEPAVIVVVVN